MFHYLYVLYYSTDDDQDSQIWMAVDVVLLILMDDGNHLVVCRFDVHDDHLDYRLLFLHRYIDVFDYCHHFHQDSIFELLSYLRNVVDLLQLSANGVVYVISNDSFQYISKQATATMYHRWKDLYYHKTTPFHRSTTGINFLRWAIVAKIKSAEDQKSLIEESSYRFSATGLLSFLFSFKSLRKRNLCSGISGISPGSIVVFKPMISLPDISLDFSPMVFAV